MDVNSLGTFVTDFGDSGVVLPIAAATFAFLVAGGWHRAAWGWLAMVAGCGAAMAALKLAFKTCGSVLGGGIVSPSGHSAMSATVYGGLAVLMAAPLPRRFGIPALIVALALACLIGWSRVVLLAHSPQEVVLGLVVGSGCAVAYRRFLGDDGIAGLPLLYMGSLAMTLALALHGTRWPVERLLTAVAAFLHPFAKAC